VGRGDADWDDRVIDTFMVKVGDTYQLVFKGIVRPTWDGTQPGWSWTYDGISHWPGCKEAPAVIGLPNGTGAFTVTPDRAVTRNLATVRQIS